MNAVTKHTEPAGIVRAEDAPMVAMIERIAMDPSIPLDRLEKMLDMKERMEDRAREESARQDRKAYFAAMAQCQAELPVVIKKSSNDHTKSKYADLAAIEAQAMPVIHAHGFMVSFQPDGIGATGDLRIKWTVAHRDGHSESDVAEIPIDAAGTGGTRNKTGTQAFGSTATYGRRYLLCMLFNISTGDDNDGNRRVDTTRISADQFIALRDLLESSGKDEAKMLAWLKIDALEELPVARYGEVDAMLRKAVSAKVAAQ